MGVNVRVGGAGFVFVAVTGEMTVTLVVGLPSKVGGGIMKGVAVTIAGVCVGTGVHTGNGWGGATHVSHAEITKKKGRSRRIFFMN
jgi:hypothetical protein